MLIRDFNALHLNGAEHIKITLSDGSVVNGVLLNETPESDKILIYNLENKKEKEEEYIKLEAIRELEIME